MKLAELSKDCLDGCKQLWGVGVSRTGRHFQASSSRLVCIFHVVDLFISASISDSCCRSHFPKTDLTEHLIRHFCT